MSEPLSGLALCGLGAMACLGGILAGADGNAATGALCGALVFVIARPDLKGVVRVLLFFVSLVMGYLFSPALGEMELWGMRPFAYPGPAAFAASATVVGIAMAWIRKREAPVSPGGFNG